VPSPHSHTNINKRKQLKLPDTGAKVAESGFDLGI